MAKTYRIYVLDMYVGKSQGSSEERAIKRFVDDCGFDSVEHYVSEFEGATANDIEARLHGSIW